MADDYKASAQWQALNRIWKALPVALRETVKDDFRLLTDMVRKQDSISDQAKTTPGAAYDFENRYLDGMSKAAKAYALKRLTQEHNDIYKEITDMIIANQFKDMDAIWDRYISENELALDDLPAVREIMCVCLERARIQRLI